MRRTRYKYRDFDLCIEPGAAGAYRAIVRDSPGGPGMGAAHFTQPFTREDVAGLVRLPDGRRRDLNAGTTEDDPPVTATIQQLGERLFRAVFTGEVEKCLRQSLREIDRYQDQTGTDKWGRHWYTHDYERYVRTFRDRDVRVLEVGRDRGESLRMWTHYFRRERLIRVGPNDMSLSTPMRARSVHGAQSEEFLTSVAAEFGPFEGQRDCS